MECWVLLWREVEDLLRVGARCVELERCWELEGGCGGEVDMPFF